MKQKCLVAAVFALVFFLAMSAIHYREAFFTERAANEEALDAVSRNWAFVYDRAGQAVVNIYTFFDAHTGHCHGVVTLYGGKPVVLTAAHCVYANEELGSGIFSFPAYLKEKGKYNVRGYGFLGNETVFLFGKFYGEADDIIVDAAADVALIRVPDTPETRETAVALAADAPQPREIVYATHWQDRCWHLDEATDDCIHGELLVPTMGTVVGYRNTSDGDERFGYNLVSFTGDSGSGLFNARGELIGLIGQSTEDKILGVYSFSADLPSIHLFLQKNLGGAEEFVGGDE